MKWIKNKYKCKYTKRRILHIISENYKWQKAIYQRRYDDDIILSFSNQELKIIAETKSKEFLRKCLIIKQGFNNECELIL